MFVHSVRLTFPELSLCRAKKLWLQELSTDVDSSVVLCVFAFKGGLLLCSHLGEGVIEN